MISMGWFKRKILGKEMRFQDFKRFDLKSVVDGEIIRTTWSALDYKNKYTLEVMTGCDWGGQLEYEICTTCIQNAERGVECSEKEFAKAYQKAVEYLSSITITQLK